MWIVNNTHLRNCYIFSEMWPISLKMQQEIVSLLTSLYWNIWGKGHIKFGFIWTSWYLKITVTISWDPREYGGKSDIHVVYVCYTCCICVIYMHIYVYIHTYTSDIHVDRKVCSWKFYCLTNSAAVIAAQRLLLMAHQLFLQDSSCDSQ